MHSHDMLRWFTVTWALGGFLSLIGFALYRLVPRAAEILSYDLSVIQFAGVIMWTLFMLVSEGYDGFYKRFAPRFAERVIKLLHRPRPLYIVLAPFYCMHYFAASKRRLLTAWTATGLIVIAVIIIGLFPTPWRSIIDFGVVAGLTLGSVFTVSKTLSRVRATYQD